mmetsp:Transcript_60109/g.99256  ORF Transcript_60109/g.99256 Transcript_60109/m.99256 type:complete len:475 (+) Transcript_60109:1027-2451(+)
MRWYLGLEIFLQCASLLFCTRSGPRSIRRRFLLILGRDRSRRRRIVDNLFIALHRIGAIRNGQRPEPQRAIAMSSDHRTRVFRLPIRETRHCQTRNRVGGQRLSATDPRQQLAIDGPRRQCDTRRHNNIARHIVDRHMTDGRGMSLQAVHKAQRVHVPNNHRMVLGAADNQSILFGVRETRDLVAMSVQSIAQRQRRMWRSSLIFARLGANLPHIHHRGGVAGKHDRSIVADQHTADIASIGRHQLFKHRHEFAFVKHAQRAIRESPFQRIFIIGANHNFVFAAINRFQIGRHFEEFDGQIRRRRSQHECALQQRWLCIHGNLGLDHLLLSMWLAEQLMRRLSKVVNHRDDRRLLHLILNAVQVDRILIRPRIKHVLCVDRGITALFIAKNEINPFVQMQRHILGFQRIAMHAHKPLGIAIRPFRQQYIVDIDALLGHAIIETIRIRQKIRQVEKLGNEFFHVLHSASLRRQFP